jgi:hypothetical protein
MKRQTHRRRLLHHEEVGYSSAPNPVVSGGGGNISGWCCLLKGGFGGRSTQRQRWEKYMDLVLSLVEKEDEEVEEGGDLKKK